MFRRALLCTLGPSSLHRPVIQELEAAGVTGFRINMSHTDLGALREDIRRIRSASALPICLDTEGPQIRTGEIAPGVTLRPGQRIRIVPDAVLGDEMRLPLTPRSAFDQLAPGMRLSVDFDSAILFIDTFEDGAAVGTVVTGGEVGSHKAVTAFPAPRLPALSEKDKLAIALAKEAGIDQYALSFCEHPSALGQLREMVGPDSTLIAKIESREGVRNLNHIAEAADGILIDRGDLSREVRLEAIPLLQKAIIRKANALGVPAYVATNLLESMVARRAPTRAEVNDVINTLIDGADGLVLAAETAIGRYPVESARMITSLLHEFENSIEGYRIEDLLGDHPLARVGRARPEVVRPAIRPMEPLRVRSPPAVRADPGRAATPRSARALRAS